MIRYLEIDLPTIFDWIQLKVRGCSVIVLHRVVIEGFVVATNLFAYNLSQDPECTV